MKIWKSKFADINQNGLLSIMNINHPNFNIIKTILEKTRWDKSIELEELNIKKDNLIELLEELERAGLLVIVK